MKQSNKSQTPMAMMLTDDQARALMQRFFDATTSIAEEQRLYDYYRRCNDIPADLRRYGLMMGWLEEGMPMQRRSARSRIAHWWAYGLSTAAMVAIIVTLGVSYNSRVNERYQIYEGSYVVKNGHRVTDLSVIMPQLQHAEALAEASLSNQAELKPTTLINEQMDGDMRQAINEILDF